RVERGVGVGQRKACQQEADPLSGLTLAKARGVVGEAERVAFLHEGREGRGDFLHAAAEVRAVDEVQRGALAVGHPQRAIGVAALLDAEDALTGDEDEPRLLRPDTQRASSPSAGYPED